MFLFVDQFSKEKICLKYSLINSFKSLLCEWMMLCFGTKFFFSFPFWWKLLLLFIIWKKKIDSMGKFRSKCKVCDFEWLGEIGWNESVWIGCISSGGRGEWEKCIEIPAQFSNCIYIYIYISTTYHSTFPDKCTQIRTNSSLFSIFAPMGLKLLSL